VLTAAEYRNLHTPCISLIVVGGNKETGNRDEAGTGAARAEQE
jgi:hypothetical protein